MLLSGVSEMNAVTLNLEKYSTSPGGKRFYVRAVRRVRTAASQTAMYVRLSNQH